MTSIVISVASWFTDRGLWNIEARTGTFIEVFFVKVVAGNNIFGLLTFLVCLLVAIIFGGTLRGRVVACSIVGLHLLLGG